MKRSLICLYSLFLLTSCSCSKIDTFGVSPESRLAINKGESAYVYSEGLQYLPKYGNTIIAHTSLLIDNDKVEDDRLCAINLKTGKEVWLFPDNKNTHFGYTFNGFSYIYNNYLVFKYLKNCGDIKQYTILCLDLDTGNVIWERSELLNNYGSYISVHGWRNYVIFTENNKRIYRLDIGTKEVTLLYEASEAEICHFKIDKDNLLFFEDTKILLSDEYMDYYYQNEAVILNLETEEEVFRYRIEPNMGRYIGNGILQDGILYANVDTYLTAVDVETGRQLWERNDPEAYILEDLIVYNGVVLKCGGNSTYGYNAQTGELLYKYDNFGSHYTTRHGKYAYMVTNAGWLAVIDIATGRIDKRIDCPDEMFFGSYPTFYGDKMYIMGLPNYLYCYSVDKMER